MESRDAPNLICVEYPGRVLNTDKMIDTLGGLNKICEILSKPKRRLELNFNPENIFSKPAYGDASATSGLLIRVRRKKTPNAVAQVTIVGKISSCFKFQSLCDYQYLPVVKGTNDIAAKCIYSEIVPQSMLHCDWPLEPSTTPFFLPPVIFSRFDTVAPSLFRKEQTKDLEESANNIIGRSRMRRSNCAICLSFNLTDPIPKECNPEVFNKLGTKTTSPENMDAVKKLFETRPVWSKSAIAHASGISGDIIKFILPCVAFFYSNGPWRALWVRIGYDPRKDFASRYYQLLDYRLRSAIGINDYVKLKKGTVLNGHWMVSRQERNVCMIGNASKPEAPKDDISSPFFKRGELPKYRQVFYQYCDIQVPEIQEMLKKLPTPKSGAMCTEKTGWLPPNFDVQCRNIMADIVREYSQKELLRDDLKSETYLEDDDDGDGDENDADNEIEDNDVEDNDELLTEDEADESLILEDNFDSVEMDLDDL